MTDAPTLFKALSNENRLQILGWLKDPRAHFPKQIHGDPQEDGVCSSVLADKLGVSAPALSVHMRQLCAAGLVTGEKVKGWVFYKRNDAAIKTALRALADEV